MMPKLAPQTVLERKIKIMCPTFSDLEMAQFKNK